MHAVGEIQGIALARRIAWKGFGAVVVMLWDEGKEARWWVMDWRRWAMAKRKGYKSFSDKDLDHLACKCTMLIGSRPDWLPAVLSSYQEADLQLWPEKVDS